MKTHRFDVLSFLSGLFMTLIGLMFLLPEEPSDVFAILGDIGNWFWPVVLAVVGVAILAPLAFRRSDDGDDAESQSAGEVSDTGRERNAR